jgi:hypothetical protein
MILLNKTEVKNDPDFMETLKGRTVPMFPVKL